MYAAAAVTEYRQSRFTAPPGSTDIWLVRHGESAAAREGIPFPLLDGQGDPELHPNGRAQAERVAERLRNLPIDAVYVTSLRRTHETAAPLCAALGVEPGVEPDLREVFLGDWEGGLWRIKAAQHDPLYLQARAEERWDVVPGAETNAMVDSRVRAALTRIAERHPDRLVVVVAHGGVIGHVMSMATGARPFAFIGADNGSISRVVIAGDRWLVRQFNETSHLHGL